MRTGRNPERQSALGLNVEHLRPGMRLGVGLSGGADSVALLRTLAERRAELGIVLHAAHLHHGLRGAEADGDAKFCRDLAASLGVEFHEARVDVEAEAQADRAAGKAAESIEEAARRLRYRWFQQLMSKGLPNAVALDAIATAHTLDDQAETVLGKLLRGAWTEGLSGIHPVLEFPEGKILRPLLGVTRADVEAYLGALGQPWREDSTNRQLDYTRNRIRHELLPLLERWNPQLRTHLAQMAELARDEEQWWSAEMERLAPQQLLTGRAVRGGGRASAGAAPESVALDVTRLAALAPAVQRRLLRLAAGRLGAAPDFAATEALRRMALEGGSGQRLELAGGLRAERSPRELRLARQSATADGDGVPEPVEAAIPGLIEAAGFGLRLRVEVDASQQAVETKAMLRVWRAGDRVRLRYTSGPRKVKEVLERMRVTGTSRVGWPVLEIGGRIVWMQGVELEPEPALKVSVEPGEGGRTGIPEN